MPRQAFHPGVDIAARKRAILSLARILVGLTLLLASDGRARLAGAAALESASDLLADAAAPATVDDAGSQVIADLALVAADGQTRWAFGDRLLGLAQHAGVFVTASSLFTAATVVTGAVAGTTASGQIPALVLALAAFSAANE